MKTERFIGLLFIAVTISFLMYFYFPDKDESIKKMEPTINVSSPNIKNKDIRINSSYDAYEQNGFVMFDEEYFDLFVYRAHVLSSENNANRIKKKIIEGGFPCFIENFQGKKDRFAVYVGPFLSEDDILKNITLIQNLSESNNGEVSRWKL